jgi:hypothetical protein
MADQEVIKHVKAAIDASRDKEKGWKQKFREILLEVGIIVFAVSLSISLHGWAESLKDRKEEREFLVGLKKDLQEDLQEMMSDRKSIFDRYSHCEYFERVGVGENANLDSVNAYQRVFTDWATISPRTSRFEALKGSGRLSIIEDKDLLNQITAFYTKDFPWIVYHNGLSASMAMNSLMPYLAAHLQADAHFHGTNWEELLRQPQMRILVHQQKGIALGTISAYDQGIDDCRKILEEVEKEVK